MAHASRRFRFNRWLLLGSLLATAACAEETAQTEVAVAQDALSVGLYINGFENGLGGFTTTGSCAINSAAKAIGGFGIRCTASASLRVAVNTAGYKQIRLGHTRRTAGYDALERFIAEYSTNNGASWTNLEQIAETSSFGSVSRPLGQLAENAMVLLRFRSNANLTSETFDLDNVVLSGMPMVPSPPDPTVFQESLSHSVNGFTVTGNCAVIDAASFSGAGVRCFGNSARLTSLVSVPFSTLGMHKLNVSFAKRTSGFDAGELFTVAVSADGTNWTLIRNFTDNAVYSFQMDALPEQVAGQPRVQIRFSANAELVSEHFDLASVRVWGEFVGPRMDGNAGTDDFFAMPWPSDHRRLADGTLDLVGFPAVDGAQYDLGRAMVNAFQPSLRGFGTNSAVFFTFTGPLTATLPQPLATVSASSPVMLVKLDNPSAPRVPVLLNFKSASANARPARLLSVLPAPGFTLDQNTRYAAILFKTLAGPGAQLERAPLLDLLASNSIAGTGFSQSEFNTLKAHKVAVDSYVTLHTDMQPSDVAAFAVYTTQPIGAEMRGAALTLAAMSDSDILQRIDDLDLTVPCTTCSGSGACPAAILEAVVQVPRFQTPVTLGLQNPDCLAAGGDPLTCRVTSTGGAIVLDAATGRAVMQTPPEPTPQTTARVQIRVPCIGGQPAGGWPTVFRAAGTGGGYQSGAYEAEQRYSELNRSLNQVVASIAPWESPERQSAHLAGLVMYALDSLDGEIDGKMGDKPIDATKLAGVLYFFPFNPVAGRNNQIQNAVDALFVKRVLDVLAQAAAAPQHAVPPTGPSPTPYSTNRLRSTLYGQSQGSGSAPLALTVSAAAGGFRDAYLNSAGGGLIFDDIVHRGDTRGTFDQVFSFADHELDRFHPFGHLLQTAVEVGAGINYAHDVSTANLLITSGYDDGCTLREGAEALATRLIRHGKLAAGNTRKAVPPSTVPLFPGMPTLQSIETILGSALVNLPMTGNLGGGRTGAFIMLPGLHGALPRDTWGGDFLSEVAANMTPSVGDRGDYDARTDLCEDRFE